MAKEILLLPGTFRNIKKVTANIRQALIYFDDLKNPSKLGFKNKWFSSFSSQMIGYNVISFYLQTIFETTNTSVRPEVSSVVIGCIQLLACFCTILLTDRFGRKPVLMISLFWMAVGMVSISFSKLGWVTMLGS